MDWVSQCFEPGIVRDGTLELGDGREAEDELLAVVVRAISAAESGAWKGAYAQQRSLQPSSLKQKVAPTPSSSSSRGNLLGFDDPLLVDRTDGDENLYGERKTPGLDGVACVDDERAIWRDVMV